ncbi:hypothetical protein [Flavobacterium lindanitolerans]|uniref:hypothetical protein n=1 Tax=Flavobacterium lindanitolerans TaxID=428988 RepID=UPI0023F2669C|nr:hypothetical protein [Flavobacterium lindanitolerans]
MDKSKEAEAPVKGGLSAKIRKAERRSADWLEKSTKHYSKKRWGMLLAIFILLSGTISAMLLIGGLTGELDNAFTLQRITRSINAPSMASEETIRDGLSRSEYGNLVKYRTYLDSLQKSPAGLERYRQILNKHPGLPDSLDTIIKTYQLQFKSR